MKHLRKFNESVEQDLLTMDDVKELNHNLGDDFMRNYDFDEDDKLEIDNREWFSGNYQGKEIKAFELYTKYGELGFAIKVDGEVEHLISIYEPHGCNFNEKRGLITVYGHEEIVHLWLEDGEFNEIATR